MASSQMHLDFNADDRLRFLLANEALAILAILLPEHRGSGTFEEYYFIGCKAHRSLLMLMLA
jgi:hypothetical protein